MPGPLVIGVEFATEAAERAMSSLVGTVKAATVDLASSILAPISPSNLVTQIAQQGMGINALAGNLVAGGIGAMGASRDPNTGFSYLVDMGQKFNAENSAINATVAMGQEFARAFGKPSDATLQTMYNMNMMFAKSDEDVKRRILEGPARKVAEDDLKVAAQSGTKLANQASMYGQAFWGMGVDAFTSWYDKHMPRHSYAVRHQGEATFVQSFFGGALDVMDGLLGR